MGRDGIPDRWLPYSPMGSVIPGTRFIACKVPLKESLLRRLPEKERFGPKDLLEAYPKIGLLVDLTNTTRYYLKQDFTNRNIKYEKIFCPGKVIPPNSIIKQFFGVVDHFLATKRDPDAVIVVHCTHGVNRTGYFICRYMIERMNMSPEESVKNFQMARGHDIERELYVYDLKNGCKGGSESDLVLSFDNNRKMGVQGVRRFGTNFDDAYNDERNSAKRFRNDDTKKNRYNHFNNDCGNDYDQVNNHYSRDRKWNNSARKKNLFTGPGNGRKNLEWRKKGPDVSLSNWHGSYQHEPPPSKSSQLLSSPAGHSHPQQSLLSQPGNHKKYSAQPHRPPKSHYHQTLPPPVDPGNPPSNSEREHYGNFKGHRHQGFRPLPDFCYPNNQNKTQTESGFPKSFKPQHSFLAAGKPTNNHLHSSSSIDVSRDRIPSSGRQGKRGSFNRGGPNVGRGRRKRDRVDFSN